MKHPLLFICLVCLCTLTRAEAFPILGTDTVSSSFFRNLYQTTDLGHYLDNYNDYVVYETETTGEWNLGDRNVFSIAGNSFRNTKYQLNGMRIDSRTMPGHTMIHTQMDRTSLTLDYHDGELSFTEDWYQRTNLRLTGNIGNLGGISLGTRQLINLFHSSAEERTLDTRPMDMRNHILGAGTLDATVKIGSFKQHAYVTYGQRAITAFDQTGISGMNTSDYYTAQLDGELPLESALARLNYFLVTQGSSAYGSEFLYNLNEQATMRAYQAGLYSSIYPNHNETTIVLGLSYELQVLHHNDLTFFRNLMDQDGEAFEPWYADGRLHSINFSMQYDRTILPWLSFHAQGYNSLLHFRPTSTSWNNNIYTQAFDDTKPTDLYTYHWNSSAFTSSILENEALWVAEMKYDNGLRLYGHIGVSLDGIVLGHGRSVITPNWLAKFALNYQPVWWFKFGCSLSHHRMSYSWDEVRYLSADYMNGEARYADNTLLTTTGGAYHTPDKNLWMHQPSYAVLDLPITFTFGKSHRHQIVLLNSLRKYYNQWFTDYTEGIEANMVQEGNFYFMREGQKQYTITTQPLDLMSARVGGRTPYYMSNTVKYTYTGKKWYVMVSWQSYLMAGLSTTGNGPLHNNIGCLSETTANPNTYMAQEEMEKGFLHQGNCRLNQDKSFILRMQVTYNACKYFSIGFNGKFKDGQPFSNYHTINYTSPTGHSQVAIYNTDAKGINMANNEFGKREDAFFNLELKATGRWWVSDIPMSLEVLSYNLYDFGTALTEYTFDEQFVHTRRTMSMCIPRGLLFTLRVGLNAD